MLARSPWFILYHLLLIALICACQGCTSLGQAPSSLAFPWQKNKLPAQHETVQPDAQSGNALAAGLAKGMAQERTAQYDKAREVYEGLLREFPERAEPLHRLAVVADKQRRHPEAQALYLRAIQIQPRNAELFNDLGFSFYLSGEMAKSESALAKGVQLEPENPRYRNNLGLVLGNMGRTQDAFTQFASVGSEADAHYNIAFIYASQGKMDEAKQCFQRALAIDPAHGKASAALASFARYEESDGLAMDDNFTPDGRRWIPYLENDAGQPDFAAMANFGINHQVDSALPSGTHNIPSNRDAGIATRSQGETARVQQSMASSR